MTAKPRIVFVGSFKERSRDGALGGQSYACLSLIRSPFSDYVDIVELDTTQESYPSPGIFRRASAASLRVMKFSTIIILNKVDGALIFTADGLSFLEKGLMTKIAKAAGKWVILCPRYGKISSDYSESIIMRWAIKHVSASATRILCQGENLSHFFYNIIRLPSDKTFIIKNWIDASTYTLPDYLGGDGNFLKVVFLGRMEERKGIYDLVESVYRFGSKLENVRFIMYGKGPELPALKRLIHERGMANMFEFPGWVTGRDKVAALGSADVFVLPSHHEGMPNALLEAMAAGRAVVASRVDEIPGLIVDDSMGVLVSPGDPDSLGQALVALCRDKERRIRLGRNARAHVLAHHRIDHAWPEIFKVIEECMVKVQRTAR